MGDANSWAIGVDLGGTKIELARVNAEGRLEQRILIRTDVKGGPAGVMSEIITAARELRKTAATAPGSDRRCGRGPDRRRAGRGALRAESRMA